ncbi:Retrovirus-related Pol polyprotein from transposon TNT 1-94-like protein [Drosera capensis]
MSYSHLRVFGCKAYVHISKEHRTKLNDKVTPCIFLGHGDEEFRYRLWDPIKKRIIKCRDVVFYEGQTYADLENDKGEQHHHGEHEASQAQAHTDEAKWQIAMQDEMKSLQENGTYELVELPKGRKALKNKWVFKMKRDGNGEVMKHKARPAGLDLELEQLDVKTAFLHGALEEEIYMVQLEGFEVNGKEHKVCKLKKSLYGLKEATRQWYKKFDPFMTSHGYPRFKTDPCVYFKRFTNGKFLILLLYVDDILVTGQDAQMIAMLKKELSKAFDMKDMG